VEDWWVSSGEAGTKCPFSVGSVGNCQGRGEHTHLWGFLPFGVRMLFVVPNPAGSLTTPIQGYERTYRSDTTQMDLCQLVFVTFDHFNSVTFVKHISNKQIPSQTRKFTFTNNVQLQFLRWVISSQCPSPAGTTHGVHLLLWGCRTFDSRRRFLSRPDPFTRIIWRVHRNSFLKHNLNEFSSTWL